VFDALGGVRLLDHKRGCIECGINVPSREAADLEEVAAGVDLWCVGGECVFRRFHRFQDLVLDFDRRGCGSRMVLRVGNDYRKHITHVTCGFANRHQQGPVGNDQTVVADTRDIFGGEYALDSRHFEGLRGIDTDQRGASMIGENERTVQHPLRRHIGHEALGAQRLISAAVAVRGRADAVAHRHFGTALETVFLSEVMRTSRGTVADRCAVPPRFAGGLDRVDDAVVPGAPAEVAGKSPFNARPILGQLLVDEVGRPHGDAWGAKAALHRALTDKGVGQQLALALRESLEGHHLAVVSLLGIQLAGEGGLSVEENGAAPAHALGRAAVLGGGNAAAFPQHLEEVHPLLVGHGRRMTVELEGNLEHFFSSGCGRR
jgi:hypothetical protein